MKNSTPVTFAEVNVDDTLVFCNRNTGFGADGTDIERTGTVTSKTDKTITVKVHDPVRVEVFERGKARTYGLTARLRAAAWYDRQVRRVMTEQPTEGGPYGVFEDGLCVEIGDTRAEADEYAARYRAADDATDVTVEPLCVEHRDAEQPRATCEECATDSEDNDQNDDGPDEPVHSHNVACGETGGVQTAWDSRLVTCEDCLRIIHPERYEEASSEGRVIAHQGAGRGVAPEHADNGDAREAVVVLEAAGLPLADLPEEYDSETSEATGFMVVPRDGGMVYVYYLEDGQTTDADGDVPRNTLRRAARALRDAGWAVEPRITACVRAHQVPQRDHRVPEEIARLVEVRNLEAAPITPKKGDALALMVRGCARAGRVTSVRGDVVHMTMLDIGEHVAALVNELPEMRAELFRSVEYGHRDGHVRAAQSRSAELATHS